MKGTLVNYILIALINISMYIRKIFYHRLNQFIMKTLSVIFIILCTTSIGYSQACVFDLGYADKQNSQLVMANEIQYELDYVDFMYDPQVSSHQIPVVVHVLEQDGETPISDNQIIAGLELANSEFASSNVNISFYLVGQTEDEECTTGINRYDIGSLKLNMSEDEWKEPYEWDRNSYMNLYISYEFSSSGAVGWGTPPWFIPQGDFGDGVVLKAEDFGNIELAAQSEEEGAVAHEFGHYLGLWHVFQQKPGITGGGGACSDCLGFHEAGNPGDPALATSARGWKRGDRINETDPVYYQFLSGTCLEPTIDQCASICNSSDPQGFTYPVDNYMNYFPVDCRSEFVNEQALRMYYSLLFHRVDLWQNNLPASCLWDSPDENITGNIIWSKDYYSVNHNVIVKSGAQLTIETNTTVKFCEDVGIYVEPGAILELKGKITSCDGQWRGINVLGPDNPQISYFDPGSGKLITRLGSEIENAQIGIQLSTPSHHNSGGVLEASGTTFNNNTISIQIPPNFSLRGYPAEVVNCIFNSEGIFDFLSFIDLRGVGHVDIAGCDFTYTGPQMTNSIVPYGYGIIARDAGFNLTPNIISGTAGPIAVESNFNGLSYGIYIYKTLSNRPFTIEKANFSKCYTGVYNGGMDIGKILYNNFYLGDVPDPSLVGDNESSQIGLFLQGNITTIEVQENDFTSNGNASFNTTGVLTDNIGSHINVIRKNNYENLTISNLATRANGEEENDDFRGLRYSCNDFGSIHHDVIVPREDVGGFLLNSKVNELQTTFNDQFQAVSAGNLFSLPDYQYGDFFNEQDEIDDYIDYRYFLNAEEPLNYFGVFTLLSPESSCAAEYCEAPCPPDDSQTNIIHLDDLKDDFIDKHDDNNDANDDMNDGNTTPQEEVYLHEVLAVTEAQMAGYTDQAFFILSNNNSPATDADLIWWIDAQNTYQTDVWLAGEYAVRGNWSQAHAVLNNIPNTYNLQGALLVEWQSISNIFSILENDDMYDLSPSGINALQSIVISKHGNASLLAGNILMLNDHEIETQYFMPSLSSIKIRSLNETNETGLNIYPNPTSNHVVVEWDYENASNAKYVILSADNRIVKNGEVEKGKSISLHSLRTGVYFINIEINGFKSELKRLMIIK